MLVPGDFAEFFREVHGHDPFPWQERLLQRIAKGEEGWPATLDLPTGSGKTAAIDIAVFHLALESDPDERTDVRCAPVRIAFVVDRRLVVDDAFERAKKLAHALLHPTGPITARVAERLQKLAGDGPPLIARRLRGGIPREDDWARTPSQPTVLCSTVDQVGSRLLFRGYGVSDPMKPVHAGLLGSDCLILLDEAHLAEPYRQTLRWVQLYRGQKWRESAEASPWGVSLLTATPGGGTDGVFSLHDADRNHSVLRKRLDATKPARLVVAAKSKAARDAAAQADDEANESGAQDLARRTTEIFRQIRMALEHFNDGKNGALAPAIGVVVNRVARARAVFKRLNEEFTGKIETGEIGRPILMIGPARPVDRDELVGDLGAIRTQTWEDGEVRRLDRPFLIVATQCIEAGVDIDLDALVTELAPLDSLRQRFGRLNRAGRDIVPYAAIVAMKADISARNDDPVYEKALKPAWEALENAREAGKGDFVEFGVTGFAVRMSDAALAPKADAPVLLPAHLDLLSQTSPIPAADPDLALYLHGPKRQPDAIAVVWRADIGAETSARDRDEETRFLLTLVPPRAAEAIELPIWAVRAWLKGGGKAGDQLADVAGTNPEEEPARAEMSERRIFRWKGDDDRSRWINPVELRPGDTVVVPAVYGGVDRFGWNPEPGAHESVNEETIKAPATDVGQRAASPFAGRHFAVRVAPELLGDSLDKETLAEALASAPSRRWSDLRSRLLELPIPEITRRDLQLLDGARAKNVVAYTDAYGRDEDGRPRGVIFVAIRGLDDRAANEALGGPRDTTWQEGDAPGTTEGDLPGSVPGFPQKLGEHNRDVGVRAALFAKAAGLSGARVADLECAGHLHDEGKVDRRFQSWLHYGDPLGADSEQILAKSGRRLPRAARDASGLPKDWRHEALSVRLALNHARLAGANDPELVLWLVGVHHGYGRPLFPHCDPEENATDVGPQSLAFDWRGLDWPSLFVRLKARYGVWELARMEAILRLADHRVSEARALKDDAR